MEQNHDYASHKKLMKVMQTMIFFIEHFELIVILIKRRVYSRVVEKKVKAFSERFFNSQTQLEIKSKLGSSKWQTRNVPGE